MGNKRAWYNEHILAAMLRLRDKEAGILNGGWLPEVTVGLNLRSEMPAILNGHEYSSEVDSLHPYGIIYPYSKRILVSDPDRNLKYEMSFLNDETGRHNTDTLIWDYLKDSLYASGNIVGERTPGYNEALQRFNNAYNEAGEYEVSPKARLKSLLNFFNNFKTLEPVSNEEEILYGPKSNIEPVTEHNSNLDDKAFYIRNHKDRKRNEKKNH